MKPNRALTVLRNTAASYLKEVVEVITFMLLTPFIAHELGVDMFGLWSVVLAAIGFFALLDMGFATSVVKYVADARGRGDVDRHRMLVATFFWVYVVLGVALLVASVPVALELPGWIHIPAAHRHTARVVFLVLALRAALSLPLSLFLGVLTGHQRLGTVNGLRILGAVSYALMVFVVIGWRPSLVALAWVNLVGNLLPVLVAMILCVVRLDGVSLSPRHFSLRHLREVTTFSIYFFLIQVSMLIYLKVDALIIQAFLTLEAVALYTVGTRVAEKASSFCRQLVNALTPLLAELKGAGEEAHIRRVFLTGTKLSTALAIPLLVGLFLMLDDFFRAWMGEAFGAGALAGRILVAAMFVSVVHANAANVLSMTGHQRFLAFAFMSGQVINLVLTFSLVRPLGIAGVALATLISTLVIDVFVVQRRAGRLHQIGLVAFYRTCVWPSVVPALVMVAVVKAGEAVLPSDSLVTVAVLEGLACLVFAAAFWRIGLDAEERAYYREKVLRVARGRRADRVERGARWASAVPDEAPVLPVDSGFESSPTSRT